MPIDTADPAAFALLNDFQREFPLCERPFRALAQELAVGEEWVIATLRRMQAAGQVSRVGPVFAPHSIGASTLAALRVAPERLDEVAARVSAFAQVNHNYAREHAVNLWFVVTAHDQAELARVLTAIETAAASGPLLVLPLLEEFRIDLAFDLRTGARPRGIAPDARPLRLNAFDRALVASIQDGLPLVPRPFAAIATCLRRSEVHVLARIRALLEGGAIRRFGIVVRHHELGFAANAMAVWDVPDIEVADLGHRLAAQPGVSLCYRRARARPHWPYNLYCMVHGRSRDGVRAQLDNIAQSVGLEMFASAVLFSSKRYKQCGARYATRGPMRLGTAISAAA